jgi:hypothetical protein
MTGGGEDSAQDVGKLYTSKYKSRKAGKDIEKTLEKLNTLFSNLYEFEGKDEAEAAIRNMGMTFELMLGEIYNVAREYELTEISSALIHDLKKKIKKY